MTFVVLGFGVLRGSLVFVVRTVSVLPRPLIMRSMLMSAATSVGFVTDDPLLQVVVSVVVVRSTHPAC
jgi:hypothetical protein